MSNLEKTVGTIKFDKKLLDVYQSLDEPLFRATDIAKMIDYSEGNTWKMVEVCDPDEKMNVTVVMGGQRRQVTFVTEAGLYHILFQSRKPLARKWSKVIRLELIKMRKSRNLDILEQFGEWDHALDDIYFDEETGVMMQSVTVAGGDVIQVPYVPKEENNE